MKSMRAALTVAVLTVLGLVATLVPAGAGSTVHEQTPREAPTADTPRVLGDGHVSAIVEFGDQVLVAGRFTGAVSAGTNNQFSRPNVFLYGPGGVVDPVFDPVVNGEVYDAVAHPDGRSVYLVGAFTSVDGRPGTSRVARIDIATGQVVPGFTSPSPDGTVFSAERFGNEMVIAGGFGWASGRQRNRMLSFDLATGQVTDTVNHSFAGTWNGGWTHVKDIEIDDAGQHLVAIGNFRSVDGQTRNQIALFDLSPAGSVLDPFSTSFYSGSCSRSFNTYMRDADIAPDGSYFAVATTGAYSGGVNAGTGCDTAAAFRFETGPDSNPIWVNYAGGDTLTQIEAAGPVVYAGGHQRWMNSPFAGDRVGPGAVPREGIAALDARNGLPLSWNPGRARGVGVYGFLATDEGLYVGSDTDFFNGSYRPKLAYVPLAGGHDLPADHVEGLPGNVYSLGQASATSTSVNNNVVKRLFDGTAVASAETVSLPGSWSSVRGATMVDGTIYHGWSDGTFRAMNAATGAVSTINLNGLTAFAADLPRIGSMFFDPVDARLYYTLDNSNLLYYRYFTPESNIVGAVRFTVPNSSSVVNWSAVRGAFLDGDTLWFGATDGALRQADWNGAPVAGTVTTVSGPGVDSNRWTARGLFVHTIDTAPNATPTAVIATPACTELTCELDGNGSTDPDGTIEGYEWDFGDDSPVSTEAAPSHTYAEGGTYTVTLTVTDNRGATATATTDVTVEPPANQPPTAVIAPPACTDLQCSFDGSGSTDPDGTVVEHSWDFGDDTAAATGAAVDHTYAAPGTYTVTLTVTDDGDTTASASTEITVTAAANQAPTAVIATPTCVRLTCTFNGSGSSDPDGTITDHDWNFGDSTTGSGATIQHTFPASGNYTVTLEVTDNDGATHSVNRQVGVSDAEPEPPAIAFRGVETSSTNATSGQVAVPASAQPGDALLLLLTYNSNVATYTQPTGTSATWTLVDDRTAGSSRTVLWRAVAQAGDAGATVRVDVTTTAKLGMQLLAYSGTDQANPVSAYAVAVETVNQASHTTPTVQVTTPGSWVVSLWTDKTSATNSWTAPAGVTVRAQTSGVGGGRVTSLSADQGPVSTGSAGGRTATSTSNVQATMWSVVLAPQTGGNPPANNPPTALIAAPACTNLSCAFDGRGSTDSDGSIVSYSWNFGDGDTATGPQVAHVYDAAGSYTVTLTVTDSGNATDTHTVSVVVTAPGDPDPATIGFVGVDTASTNSNTAQLRVPADVEPGDALLLFLSYNRTSATFTAPAGTSAAWSQVAVRTAGSSTTVVWQAVAEAGDAGAVVTVGLSEVSKLGAQLLAYTGTDPAGPVDTFAAAVESANTAAHTTPTVSVGTPGSWLVSLWSDKTSATDAWTPPAGATARAQTTYVGGGRITTLSADSGAPVPTGTAGGLTASSTPNVQATMWSLVLVPAP